MKLRTKILALWVLPLSFSSVAFSGNSIKGTCSFKITGNDTTSNLFTNYSEDKKLEGFKESYIEVDEFQINSHSRHKVHLNFERVVPFSNDINKFQNYQIISFKNDQKSKDLATAAGAEYELASIKKKVTIAIGYNGHSDTVVVDIMGVKNKAKTIIKKVSLYDDLRISFNYTVPLNYKDYGGDGFFGSIFKGDITQDDAKKAKVKTVFLDVKGSCNIYANGGRELDTEREDAQIEKDLDLGFDEDGNIVDSEENQDSSELYTQPFSSGAVLN